MHSPLYDGKAHRKTVSSALNAGLAVAATAGTAMIEAVKTAENARIGEDLPEATRIDEHVAITAVKSQQGEAVDPLATHRDDSAHALDWPCFGI